MKKGDLPKKKISYRIMLAITACCTAIALLVGGISIAGSSRFIESEAKDKLLSIVESKTSGLDKTIAELERSVEGLATSANAIFDMEKLKTDTNYILDYQPRVEELTKNFGEMSDGVMGAYVYINPELTGGVYGGWFADKQNNKVFEKQALKPVEAFDPNNADMDWYYEPVKAGKAVWLEPYTDPDLNIKMVSYVVPFYKDSTLLGVAGMDVNFDDFSRQILGTKLYDTGYMALLDKDYNFLVRPSFKQGDTAAESQGNAAAGGQNADAVSEASAATQQENLAKENNGALKALTDEIGRNDTGMTEYTYEGLKKIFGYSHLTNGYIITVDVPRDQVLKNIHKLTILIAGLILLGILAAIVTALLVGRLISKPIVQVTDLVNRTANFDLTYDKQYESLLKHKDETGIMARAVIDMRKLLKEIVEDIKQDAAKTSEYTGNLASSAEISSDSMTTVSKAAEEMAQGAAKQAEASQIGSNELAGLAGEIESSVENTNMVREYIDKTSRTSKEAVEYIQILQQSFEETNKASVEIASSIKLLSEKSGSISEIISVIKSIAEQTNMLALNAAIEAARAGEHGRGFAVVADEVRKLAEQTSASTREIEDIISEIQNDISSAKAGVDSAGVVITQSNKALADAENAFGEIDEAVRNTMVKIDQLIDSIRGIDKNKNQVVSSIQEISSVCRETAATSEEISASLENQTAAMESISEAAEQLKPIVMSLGDIINKFKI
ncbi:MAG: methyl-accepting chemotaxis protein [Caulobacteraceae bacterium]